MNQKLSLSDKVVLVTGAGQGIGRALIREALHRGAVPVGVERDPERAAALEADIGQRGAVFVGNVSDMEAMQEIVSQTVKRFGGIDVVIANAGIERVATFQDMPPAMFEEVLETNLLGVYRTIQPTLESVMSRKGHITAISSIAGLVPFPLAAAYSTSKSAVDMLMRVLRMELTGTGTTVGTAYFGFVQTAMSDRIFNDPITRQAIERLPSRLLGITPLPTAERTAELILDGVEKRRAHVFAPPMVRVTFLFRGIYALFDGIFARKIMRLPDLIASMRRDRS